MFLVILQRRNQVFLLDMFLHYLDMGLYMFIVYIPSSEHFPTA